MVFEESLGGNMSMTFQNGKKISKLFKSFCVLKYDFIKYYNFFLKTERSAKLDLPASLVSPAPRETKVSESGTHSLALEHFCTHSETFKPALHQTKDIQ